MKQRVYSCKDDFKFKVVEGVFKNKVSPLSPQKWLFEKRLKVAHDS